MSFRKGIGKRSDHRIGVKSTAFQDRNNKNFTTFLKNPIAEQQKMRLLFSIKRSNDYRWGNKELMSVKCLLSGPLLTHGFGES